MAILAVTVSQHNVRRENGHVKGTIQINVENPDFELPKDFDYPTDGKCTVLDQDFPLVHLNVVIEESPHGQSCVTGYVEVSALGVKTKKDFDKNCEAIREA